MRPPGARSRGAARANPLPHLEAGDDPVVCRLRTLVVACTAVAVVGAVSLLLGDDRPVAGWTWVLVAVLVLPAVWTSVLPVLLGLAALLMVYLVSWPGLGGWTSVALFTLHTAAAGWFLGSTVRPSAVLHRSALRTIGLRWLWMQAVAQLGVGVAVLTAGLDSDSLLGLLGVLALLGVVGAITVMSRSRGPSAR